MSIELLARKLRAVLPGNQFDPHQIGAAYATGDGVAENLRTAARWYRLGAWRGDPESQYDLGFMYLLGEGVNVDPARGVKLLKRAARSEQARAARLLSQVYDEGRFGVARDESESKRWREQALELEWPAETP